MSTLILKGFLGKDREILQTTERTEIRRRWNDVAEQYDEYEVTLPARDYARLSLSAMRQVDGRWVQRWHRLVVWGLADQAWWNVRLARKGDRVRVTGHEEVYRFTDEDGVEHEITQIVVESFQILRPKTRREWP